MNKYQKAFKTILEDLHPDGGLTTLKEVELIEELIDKEIPMKPINQYPIDFGLGNYGECKQCKKGVNYQQNYCSNCGQKVGWSEINE